MKTINEIHFEYKIADIDKLIQQRRDLLDEFTRKAYLKTKGYINDIKILEEITIPIKKLELEKQILLDHKHLYINE